MRKGASGIRPGVYVIVNVFLATFEPQRLYGSPALFGNVLGPIIKGFLVVVSNLFAPRRSRILGTYM